MLRTKVYVIDEPLFYDYSEVDISQTRLLEIQIADDKGNVIKQENFDDDGLPESIELSVYNEYGKPLSFELFIEARKQLFRRTVFEYTVSGELKSERVYIDGQIISEQINYFGAGNQIQKKIIKKENESDKVSIYHYHQTFPECCVREEILENNLLCEIITREWELKDGEPFLTEERTERLDNPMALRITRFYDPKENENGVASELYNDLGDFMEETRNFFDDRGRIEKVSRHTDSFPASTGFIEEGYEYDEKDRIILSQYSRYSKIDLTTKWTFDEHGRITKRLEKSSSRTQVFFLRL
jgi:hypothetical protein